MVPARALRESGVAILVVGQSAYLAMKRADCVYMLEHGRGVLECEADEMASHRELTEAYLGE